MTSPRPHWDLIAAFVAGQAADVVTWLAMEPAREMNPLVVALGPGAIVPKAFLVMFTTWLAIRFPSPAVSAVLVFGALAGLFGAWSNL